MALSRQMICPGFGVRSSTAMAVKQPSAAINDGMGSRLGYSAATNKFRDNRE
jgi:hypothetical protein